MDRSVAMTGGVACSRNPAPRPPAAFRRPATHPPLLQLRRVRDWKDCAIHAGHAGERVPLPDRPPRGRSVEDVSINVRILREFRRECGYPSEEFNTAIRAHRELGPDTTAGLEDEGAAAPPSPLHARSRFELRAEGGLSRGIFWSYDSKGERLKGEQGFGS